MASDEQAPLPHASPNGIAVQVIQFLQPFLLAVNIEGVEPRLPDSVARVAVNGRRQAQPRQHRPAPRMLAILAEHGDDPLGRPLLQLLHEAAGALSGLGLDEEMKVLWQNPAEQQKAHLLPKLLEDLDKVLAETVAPEELGAAISAGGNELQLSAGMKMPPVNGHDGR